MNNINKIPHVPDITTKYLNINKIKTLDDVKRVLDFLNIHVVLEEGMTHKNFDKVKDLFD